MTARKLLGISMRDPVVVVDHYQVARSAMAGPEPGGTKCKPRDTSQLLNPKYEPRDFFNGGELQPSIGKYKAVARFAATARARYR